MTEKSSLTGVILAGGASSRMGSNKALLPYRGGRFIEAIHQELTALFGEVVVVTNSPDQYAFLPCRKVADVFQGMGALAGIHAGLRHSRGSGIFAVGCDMPYLNTDLILHLVSLHEGYDAVIPHGDAGYEPLHAVYTGRSLAHIEAALAAGCTKIMGAITNLRVRLVDVPELELFDPQNLSFSNINSPEEYFRLREREITGNVELPSLAGIARKG